jgi:hypothetical protein
VSDGKALSSVQRYTDSSLSAVISNCVHAKEAYDALEQQMRSALQIRKSVNISRITKLTQGFNRLDTYLCEAQDLTCEARTIAVTAQMEQLCTQIVTGLREDIRRAIRDAVLSISEENLHSESNADDIETVFNLIVNRIRARGAQLFPQHMFSTSMPGKAAAFAVPLPGPDPSPPHSSLLPPKAPQNGQEVLLLLQYS